jgi:hypothetical protein
VRQGTDWRANPTWPIELAQRANLESQAVMPNGDAEVLVVALEGRLSATVAARKLPREPVCEQTFRR